MSGCRLVGRQLSLSLRRECSFTDEVRLGRRSRGSVITQLSVVGCQWVIAQISGHEYLQKSQVGAQKQGASLGHRHFIATSKRARPAFRRPPQPTSLPTHDWEVSRHPSHKQAQLLPISAKLKVRLVRSRGRQGFFCLCP